MTQNLSLKGRALKLLSQREHSRQELTQKLRAHAASPDELPALLDELQAKGFISEQRVAESVLHQRSGKLGTARIRQELQKKGVPGELIAQVSAQLKLTEEARAREVWRKKFGTPPASPQERARQLRFLAARGFAPEVLHRVVGEDAENPDSP